MLRASRCAGSPSSSASVPLRSTSTLPTSRPLEAALISEGLAEWAKLAEQALREPHDPLAALGHAYRSYALDHPHLYRLMTEGPLPREQLSPGVEDRAGLPVIEAAGGDPDLARALWAFAHGMAILELNHRFHRTPTSTPPGAAASKRSAPDAEKRRGRTPESAFFRWADPKFPRCQEPRPPRSSCTRGTSPGKEQTRDACRVSPATVRVPRPHHRAWRDQHRGGHRAAEKQRHNMIELEPLRRVHRR